MLRIILKTLKVNFSDLWQWCGYSNKENAKKRLVRNFEEGFDFLQMDEPTTMGVSAIQAHPKKIITLTVDAAKEFAMLAQTSQGKEVRKYFIEAEKHLRARPSFQLPSNYIEALKALVKSEEEKEKIRLKLEDAKPKIAFADAVDRKEYGNSIGDFAKAVGSGRTRMFKQLRKMRIIQQNATVPYQKYIESGYFIVGISEDNFPYCRTTKKGEIWLTEKLKDCNFI